jgi:hypothetical protein
MHEHAEIYHRLCYWTEIPKNNEVYPPCSHFEMTMLTHNALKSARLQSAFANMLYKMCTSSYSIDCTEAITHYANLLVLVTPVDRMLPAAGYRNNPKSDFWDKILVSFEYPNSNAIIVVCGTPDMQEHENLQ